MANNELDLEIKEENQFFNNKKVPYCLKAGAAAVLLHATVNYYTTTEKQNVFMAMFFDKDIDEQGRSQRGISGTMSFTFGKHESMGKDNCQASVKKLVDVYPAVGDVLDHISENSDQLTDEEICKILADASANRFKHNETGSIKNWENYVSKNMDEFIKQSQSHYPGMISTNVYDALKNTFKNACKKKTTSQAAQQM